MKIKVAVGLSGGVDSAVSAAILKRAGFEVAGVYLHCFPESFQKTLDCTDKEDFRSAQEVAKTLKIPFTFYDFEDVYQEKVIEYFFREYQAGRTPNPDAVCNKEIKFGLFLEKALEEMGVDFVATGHYARIITDGAAGPVGLHPHPTSSVASLPAGARWGTPAPATRRFVPNDESLDPRPYTLNPNYHLLSGIDSTKDQSYFLYNLSQQQLSHILFPVGEYTKKEVRQMAKDFGLPNWQRKDSQGICFLGKISVRKFLEQRIKPKKGEVVDTSGRVIGEHDGVWFYTIGQRHGFKVSSKFKVKSSKLILPLYVVEKEVENNRLVVGWGKECEKDRFWVEEVNWVNGEGKKVRNCQVRIRHLGELYPCRLQLGEVEKRPVTKSSYSKKLRPGEIEVVLEEPAWGVASGQTAVFYSPRGGALRGDKEEVLGGGVIA